MADNKLISDKKLNEFGKDYVKILYRLLRKKDKVATGALINSLNHTIREDANQILIQIEANDYLKWVDEGRKPGTYPPIRPLVEWTQVRGINPGVAYAIQKSIYKFGIKPTNVIQETITEIESSPTLQRKYEDEVVDNLIKMINNDFNLKQ